MANKFHDKVWVIDTESATAITQEPLLINTFRVVGMTTAGHTCIVQDKNGNTVWEAVADVDKFNDQTLVDLQMQGLIVPTLTSGRLYIYTQVGSGW